MMRSMSSIKLSDLSDPSQRVLRFLMDRKVASGWELASVVGGPENIKAAVEPLLVYNFVDFTSDLDNPERMLKSYINLKPSAVSVVKQVLFPTP
jgi:hypothetical protein